MTKRYSNPDPSINIVQSNRAEVPLQVAGSAFTVLPHGLGKTPFIRAKFSLDNEKFYPTPEKDVITTSPFDVLNCQIYTDENNTYIRATTITHNLGSLLYVQYLLYFVDV